MPQYQRIADAVFTVSDLFTPGECDEYIALAEGIGFAEAPITTFGGPVMRKDVRNNERVMLDDSPRAAVLWERVRPYLGTIPFGDARPVGVNERLRFYRYDPGQVFRWHRDGYYQRPTGERSRLTYMVYLNDDFERRRDDVPRPGRRRQTAEGHGAGLPPPADARRRRRHPRPEVRGPDRRDVRGGRRSLLGLAASPAGPSTASVDAA